MDNTRVAVYLLGQDLTVLHDFTDDDDVAAGTHLEQVPIR